MNKNDEIHRAIPVQVSDEEPDGFIRIKACFECHCWNDDAGFCPILNKYTSKYPKVGTLIDNNCPLLTVAQLRVYPASEKPGREKIHIKYKTNNRETWGTGWMLIYDWHVEGKGIVPSEDVISWRNLPGRESLE